MNPHEKIQAAYEKGELLVSMLEHRPFETDGSIFPSTRDLFAVMAGQEEAHYFNGYKEVRATRAGFKGLSSTALHKDYPVPLWNDASDIGLLLDAGDQQNLTPLFVSSVDTRSKIRSDVIRIEVPEPIGELRRLQHEWISDNVVTSGQSVGLKHVADMASTAREALKALWKNIADMGWPAYFKLAAPAHDGVEYQRGINEVFVTANLRAVKGIVVSGMVQALGRVPDVAASAREALKLRAWLRDTYPDVFKDVPIFYYDPARTHNRLVKLTPDQLRAPDQLPRELGITTGRNRAFSRF